MDIDPYDLGPPVFKEEQVITLSDVDHFIKELTAKEYEEGLTEKDQIVRHAAVLQVFLVLRDFVIKKNRRQHERG